MALVTYTLATGALPYAPLSAATLGALRVAAVGARTCNLAVTLANATGNGVVTTSIYCNTIAQLGDAVVLCNATVITSMYGVSGSLADATLQATCTTESPVRTAACVVTLGNTVLYSDVSAAATAALSTTLGTVVSTASANVTVRGGIVAVLQDAVGDSAAATTATANSAVQLADASAIATVLHDVTASLTTTLEDATVAASIAIAVAIIPGRRTANTPVTTRTAKHVAHPRTIYCTPQRRQTATACSAYTTLLHPQIRKVKV